MNIDIETESKEERIRKQKIRQQMTNFETVKERISLNMRMRKLREGRTGKEHLKENLKSKKGMRILRKEGRLEEFSTSCNRGKTELETWNTYCIGSEDNETNLRKIRPDIVQKLNQKKI